MSQPIDIRSAERVENWSDSNPDLRMQNAFLAFKGMGSEHAAVVYFELEPGHETGVHRDSAEEIVLVLDGEVEAHTSDDVTRLTVHQLAVIPADAPHNVRNVGATTARVIGFFAAGHVRSRFEDVLQPDNLSDFNTADIPV